LIFFSSAVIAICLSYHSFVKLKASLERLILCTSTQLQTVVPCAQSHAFLLFAFPMFALWMKKKQWFQTFDSVFP